MDTNRVYVWRSYDIEGGVVVNPGVRNYPFGATPAERHLDICTPSEHPELPQTLANIQDEQDVLAFVRKYGLLGHDDIAPPEKRVGGDPLDWFLCHAATVRLLLELTTLLEQKDVAGLEKCLNVGGRHAPVETHPQADFLREDFAFVRYAAQHEIVLQGFGIGSKDMLTLARDVRRRIINVNIRYAYHFLHEVEGEDVLVEGINALSEAVYQHVADIVTWHRKVRRCAAPDCRQLFVQNTKRQKFCPPSTGVDSRCAQRIRKRRKRER